MKIHAAILQLLYAYGPTSPEMSFNKADDVIRNDDFITPAQTIMGNGVLIVQHHDFEHPPRWCYEL
jgi:hypothetical protein